MQPIPATRNSFSGVEISIYRQPGAEEIHLRPGEPVLLTSEYARVICDVCAHYGIPYAEVVFADRASSTYDNVHSNVAGMADMAAQVYGQLKDYLD